jgi:hypothetical protein
MNYKTRGKNMDEIKIRELVGANMDIDLFRNLSSRRQIEQDRFDKLCAEFGM